VKRPHATSRKNPRKYIPGTSMAEHFPTRQDIVKRFVGSLHPARRAYVAPAASRWEPQSCFLDLPQHTQSLLEGVPFALVPRASRENLAADEYGRFGNLDELEQRVRIGGSQNGFISALPGRELQGGGRCNETNLGAHDGKRCPERYSTNR
jgi:hypothetical protein